MRRDMEGLTLIELAVVSGIFMLTLAIIGVVLNSALRTTRGAQQESESLADARLALNRVERDIRGTLQELDFCNPTGYCLGVRPQLGTGAVERVRYRVENAVIDGKNRTVLYRDRLCAQNFTSCDGGSQELLTLLENRIVTPNIPVFTCSGTSRPVRVDIVLAVAPLRTSGGESGTVRLTSSAAARNVTSC